MTEIPISQEQIHNLGRQLDGITGDSEKALLSGILAVAAQAIHSGQTGGQTGGQTEDPAEPLVVHTSDPTSVVVEVERTLPSFKVQIAEAFTPGVIEVADDADAELIRVGHGKVTSIRVGG